MAEVRDKPSEVPDIDPALLVIIANRLEMLARGMMNTVLRTARSAVLSMARDCSATILTADDRLLAFAESLPIHIGGIHYETAAMRELHGDRMRPGDAFLNNSPYLGGTHHADHTILVPVFAEERHVFTIAVKAHQADIGNSEPTTYMAEARDIYEEGALALPCVRVQADYEDIDDMIRLCRNRIRVPDQWYGDYLAALGAARTAERGLHELFGKYGVSTVLDAVEEWFAYSERRMVSALSELRSGSWEAMSCHDPFPGIEEGLPVTAKVAVDAEQGNLVVDLRDNPPSVPSGLNMSKSTTTAAARIGVLNSLDPSLPINDGSLGRIEVLMRTGSVVGAQEHPVSCSMATSNVADRVVNAVRIAMAQAVPEAGSAEAGPAQPASMAVISGDDDRRGREPYINQLFLGGAGGPGTADTDGWIYFECPSGCGLCYHDSVEVDEQKYPVIVMRQELRADSGGPGRQRGAPGAITEFGPVGDAPMVAAYATDGCVTPANGAHGGMAGARAAIYRVRADGDVEELPAVNFAELAPGELLRCIDPGGGGYGPPKDRDHALVMQDVRDGFVSLEQAREIYGVELEEGQSVSD